jgi:hypothetical protein
MRIQTIVIVGVAVALIAALILGWYTSTHWVETQDFGKFRLTKYWVSHPLHWELSGARGVRRMTLCSRISNFCLEDRYLFLNPDPEFRTPRYTLVKGFENRNLVHFLDTATGLELQCRNCETPLAQLVPSSYMPWAPSGELAVLASQDGASPWLILLGFEPNGITATRIAIPRSALAVHAMETQFSPNGDVLAWFTCARNCVLWWYRISDQRSDHRVTPCLYTDYLDIGWEGNTPRAEFFGGAPVLDMCPDANGTPVLPITERPQ